ncbi:biliverdin-producing heme oxygenase [Paenibacillus wulumuqiensis]|uniref:biliverdin-producing heme oxygenase n=1 Tax=Paenibacillus wulumuqiensis TaxID=1567107 RepID=UPI000619DADF|nr:biliverdin-producing heme oxygenase [Paenibacillus wulumuqiensis]
MTTNVLERLRQDTAEAHQQIENNAYAKSMMDKSMTLPEYVSYLKLFYGFLKPLEQQAVQTGLPQQLGFDMTIRGKSVLLEQDLLHLGVTHEQLEQLPMCTQLPDLSTPARMIGCFYVIEGSTLGGQIITKQLMKFLPVEPGAGISYFNGYGQDTREQWLAFRQMILDNSASEEESLEIVHSARETFRLLDQWLGA